MPVDDQTDFHGILSLIPPGTVPPHREPYNNAATSASAAGVRAFTAQAIAFNLRAPVKAFFRIRVGYLVWHIRDVVLRHD